eukprot:390069-Rhodomonas_salina.1
MRSLCRSNGRVCVPGTRGYPGTLKLSTRSILCAIAENTGTRQGPLGKIPTPIPGYPSRNSYWYPGYCAKLSDQVPPQVELAWLELSRYPRGTLAWLEFA